jgi:eukaryotic-like serine/threonine-protein kinase
LTLGAPLAKLAAVMDPSARIGQTFRGCTIRKLLGRGAKGLVYLAHQASLDRPVAIKLLPGGSPEERMLALTAEARALARINHPNVLRVLEVGVESGTPFIITEFLEGETLHERLLRDGRLPVDTALKIAGEMADGLAAAHRERIVHRDLKPSNVFLRPSDPLKIIDFGLAARGADRPAEAAGTPEYMAPEQWRGVEVDDRTDLYALGVIMFRMLTGRLPFTGTTLDEMREAHLSQVYAAPPTTSARVARYFAIVENLVQKDPAARIPTAAALRQELDLLRSGKPPRAASQFGPVVTCARCGARSKPVADRCACGRDLTGPEQPLPASARPAPPPKPAPAAGSAPAGAPAPASEQSEDERRKRFVRRLRRFRRR